MSGSLQTYAKPQKGIHSIMSVSGLVSINSNITDAIHYWPIADTQYCYHLFPKQNLPVCNCV